jgi:SAM-dependent methyltransferase
MRNGGTAARADVLEFYRDLPFNYRTSAAEHADAIRQQDSLKAYPPLVAALARRPRLIDVGCGAGWLVNTAAYHHGCAATGVDFNPVAVERAREVARHLEISPHFEAGDLFALRPAERYQLVTSIGVLHHTDDCLGGIRHLADAVLAPAGRIFIGLYHEHGRRPFLHHFSAMRAAGANEQALFDEFARLACGSGTWERDETYLRSWFRDQVLHPHETCHTLAELLPLFDRLGLELESTSVNRFAPLPKRDALLAAEQELHAAGQRALKEGRYFPGFFVVMARRGF